jgi:carbon monoxide dehydrogenase subunit G
LDILRREVAAVSESIEIAVTPQEVWAVVMDPHRLGDWVTAHKKVEGAPEGELSKGDSFKQKLRVVGPSFKVKWTVVEASEPTRAVWEGRGPAGSKADVTYDLSETEEGTRFDYCNNFELPGGPLGLAAKGIAGTPATKRARQSLANLKKLLES